MIGRSFLLVVALVGALIGALAVLLEMGLRRSRRGPQRTGITVFAAALTAVLAVGAPLGWASVLGAQLLLGWHLGRWAIREVVGQPRQEPRRAIRNPRWGHGLADRDMGRLRQVVRKR